MSDLRQILNGKGWRQGVILDPHQEILEHEGAIGFIVLNQTCVRWGRRLVHRNYFISGPHKLFIFDSRIEIISPGCLPNTLTVEQVKSGSSIPRNPILHGLASRILPYRGIGTGIRRALRLYPQIEIENSIDRNELRVVLSRESENR